MPAKLTAAGAGDGVQVARLLAEIEVDAKGALIATNVRILDAGSTTTTPTTTTTQPTTAPLLRAFSPSSGDHFYTTSVAERDKAVASLGYVNEGVACHVYPSR